MDRSPVRIRQPAPSTTAPQHLTSFVGRDAELRALKALLSDSRLVTITGTGGAGKTRLAAELTRSGLERWPDGVWWIDLAGADDVTGTVIATAELPGRGRPIDVVTSWLAARQALLVLDNCEHLIAASAAFCQAALERCPHLTILATSREPLGIPGEARWPLTSLMDTDALHLFEARARLVRPDFSAKPQAETIALICERLDRLPLAIEMASARLDMMSEQELLRNLNDRFRVLASGARMAPERQQTMAAAIDWSHRLLTGDEARLFRRLAVFQGGFTMEGAQAVCAEAGAGNVLAFLSALVQKSMVVAERLDDGSTRYRLMESHNAYAIEKLRESGELETTRQRLYEYFATFPGAASQARWKALESANVWAALGWARDNVEDAGLGLALEVADSEFTDSARARALLLDLLERSPKRSPLRAKGLNLAARLASRQADHAAAKALADQSVDVARKVADSDLIAQVLNGAGFVYHTAGELSAPARMYDEALVLLKGSNNRHLAIEVQNQRGWLAIEQGKFADALKMLDACVIFARSQRDTTSTARFLESLANAQLGLGERDKAAASWMESLSIYRDMNDPFGTIWCVGGLALIAAAAGDAERTLRLASIADRMSREWSLSALSFRLSQLEDACERARAKLGSRRSEAVWTEGQTMKTDRALEYALGEDKPQADASGDAGPLSRREREVAAMVAAGLTNREIASRLFIAERTAEGHVERIRNKLGVRSRTEVATWAVERGLVARKP